MPGRLSKCNHERINTPEIRSWFHLTEYSLLELQCQSVGINSNQAGTEQSMSPYTSPQRVKLMRLHLSNHLGRAIPKTMRRSSTENAFAVLFYSPAVCNFRRLLHRTQPLTPLIMVYPAEICDHWDKVRAIPFRNKPVHETKMRACSKPATRPRIGEPRPNHLSPHAIVPLR